MRHQHACIWGGTVGTQGGIEFGQAFQDECDAAILAWQRIQDGVVEHKKAMHLAALLQGRGQGGVVVQTQVAAQPDQAGIKKVSHGGS